jgi:toxin ParE1/3/4
VKRYQLHPEARIEYLDAAAYYSDITAELGGRFYDEIEALISDVRRRPLTYPIYDAPVRRHLSQVFPYSILYRDEPDRVFIVAVMNMRRKPGYWKSRLKT